jgi:hypothetical protein
VVEHLEATTSGADELSSVISQRIAATCRSAKETKRVTRMWTFLPDGVSHVVSRS